MRALPTLLIIFLTFLNTTLARQPPTSFCKCICFTNSTIIPLNSSPQQPPHLQSVLKLRDEDEDGHDGTAHKRLMCNDCTRAFCLDYDLPICRGAKEEDVFTTCFQRDSVKDETIVLLFIIMTTGLLGWAVVRPWVSRLRDTDSVQRYAPVGNLNIPGLARSARSGELPSFGSSGENRHRASDSGGSESFARQGGLNS